MAGEATVRALRMGRALVTGGTNYEPETEALVARFSTPPTTQRKGLINNYIKSLKTGNIWANLTALWVQAAADSQAARLNWIQSAYTLTAVGSLTFIADVGYQGDGISAYPDTNLPQNAASPFTQDSASVGGWITGSPTPTSASNSNHVIGTGNATNGVRLKQLQAASSLGAQINAAATLVLGGAPDSRLGFKAASRPDASNVEGFADVYLGSGASPSTSPGATSFRLLAQGASTSPDTIGMAFIGGYLSPTQMMALRTATLTYLTAIGAA